MDVVRTRGPERNEMIDVLIVGAGPAGLLLASELRLADVDTVVLERHPQRPGFCRGFNLNARALDQLARRGLADRLIGEGWQVPHAAFSGLPVTLSLAGARTDHPYSLGIPQTRVEEILEAHAPDLGADLRRGHELRALEQDSESVITTIATDDGEYRVRAAYLVGCDAGRSTVRNRPASSFQHRGNPLLPARGRRAHRPGGVAVRCVHRPRRDCVRDPSPPATSGSSPPTSALLQTPTRRSPWNCCKPPWTTRSGVTSSCAPHAG
jgi:2-polyprenyl-6-methoxyphenol hydroxylase-like FAD-dependent oxidoreductase